MRTIYTAKLLLLLFVLIVGKSILKAQQISFSYGAGIGTYSMKSIKELNSYSLTILPFNARMTDNFPPTLFQEFSLGVTFNRIGLGLSYDFNTTGSRASYKDYSGEYTDDIIISGHLPALYFNYLVQKKQQFDIGIQAKTGVIFTESESETTIKIGQDSSVTKLNISAKSIFIYPRISLIYKPIKLINVGLNVGYLYDFGGTLKQDGKTKLYNPETHKEIKSGWGGVRADVTLTVNLPHFKEKLSAKE